MTDSHRARPASGIEMKLFVALILIATALVVFMTSGKALRSTQSSRAPTDSKNSISAGALSGRRKRRYRERSITSRDIRST